VDDRLAARERLVQGAVDGLGKRQLEDLRLRFG